MRALPIILFAVLFAVIVGAVREPLLPAAAYKDGPIPGRAGGFDGLTCHECHRDNPINAPGGRVTLSGLPDRYTPGEAYRITVELRRAELERGGFSMAVRFAAGADKGAQAGELSADDDRVAIFRHDAVSFAQHSTKGTRAQTAGTIAWTLTWKAPLGGGPVQFNLAGNATNDDSSPLGDFIYVREITLRTKNEEHGATAFVLRL